jgi:hypothetical protein
VGGRKTIAGGELCVFKNPLRSHTGYAVDKNGVEFHIAVNDYFGTLATVLALWAQDLNAGRTTPKAIAQSLFKKKRRIALLTETDSFFPILIDTRVHSCVAPEAFSGMVG